jgi:hypothetical protein
MSIVTLGCSFYHSLQENATELLKTACFPPYRVSIPFNALLGMNFKQFS